MKFVSLAVALMALASPPQEQTQLTEAQARKIAQEVAARSDGDPKKFEKGFVEAAKALVWTFSTDPTLIYYSDEISVFLTGPASLYVSGVSERIRKFEPIAGVPWPKGVSIVVYPQRIDAPNFEKLILMRDGVRVAPILDELKPQVLETRIGAKRTINAGTLIFPTKAFATGGEVIVTLVPESGSNVRKALANAERMKIH